jgi:hypothetical protein
MKTKPRTTPYLFNFEFLEYNLDGGEWCNKIEVCPATGEHIRAQFRTWENGLMWERFRPGLGVVFNRPILDDKKKSVYYLEEAKKARSSGKSTDEINLLLDFAATAQRHEAEAEKPEVKQNRVISLKGQIWNLDHRHKKK